MDWITHTGSAVAGALTVLAPVLFWSWRQKNSIENQQAKDAYEMDKVRRSDAYQEQGRLIEEGRKDRDSLREELHRQAKRVDELQVSERECNKKTSMLEIDNYKQAKIIEFLETRVKTLEAAIAGPAAVSGQGNVLAAAVKEVAKEAIAEGKPQ